MGFRVNGLVFRAGSKGVTLGLGLCETLQAQILLGGAICLPGALAGQGALRLDRAYGGLG